MPCSSYGRDDYPNDPGRKSTPGTARSVTSIRDIDERRTGNGWTVHSSQGSEAENTMTAAVPGRVHVQLTQGFDGDKSFPMALQCSRVLLLANLGPYQLLQFNPPRVQMRAGSLSVMNVSPPWLDKL